MSKRFWFCTCRLMVVLALIKVHPATAQQAVQDYYDRDYGYVFQYPASWKLQQLPEGDANKEIRLLLHGTE